MYLFCHFCVVILFVMSVLFVILFVMFFLSFQFWSVILFVMFLSFVLSSFCHLSFGLSFCSSLFVISVKFIGDICVCHCLSCFFFRCCISICSWWLLVSHCSCDVNQFEVVGRSAWHAGCQCIQANQSLQWMSFIYCKSCMQFNVLSLNVCIVSSDIQCKECHLCTAYAVRHV